MYHTVVSVIPSDRVEFDRDGMTFGAESAFPTVETETVATPETLGSLASILRADSKLLLLRPQTGVTKVQVLEAYGHDLGLLDGMLTDLRECLHQAVRCSIVVGGDRKLSAGEREDRAAKLWKKLQEEIPLPQHLQNQLRLPYTLAAEEPDVILQELRGQFEGTLAQALHWLALQLKSLVDQERVGFVTWAGADVCCYHYFVREHRESVVGERTYEESDRQERRVKRERKVRKGEYLTRHVHHLVEARLQDLGEYTGTMPARVRQFLDSVPPRVRHLFQIVDGQMTLEEVVVRKVGETTDVETETVSVYRYDPGVTLGDYVLVGWDSTETEAEQKQLKEEEEQRSRQWWDDRKQNLYASSGWILGVIVASVLLTVALWAVNSYKSSQEAKQKELQDQYDEYVGSHVNKPVFTTKKGDTLKIGDGARIAYGGRELGHRNHPTGKITFLVGREQKATAIQLTPMPGKDNEWYGDVNLESLFGIRITLHVRSANEDAILYAVSENK